MLGTVSDSLPTKFSQQYSFCFSSFVIVVHIVWRMDLAKEIF